MVAGACCATKHRDGRSGRARAETAEQGAGADTRDRRGVHVIGMVKGQASRMRHEVCCRPAQRALSRRHLRHPPSGFFDRCKSVNLREKRAAFFLRTKPQLETFFEPTLHVLGAA
jgi:hypothetical protein